MSRLTQRKAGRSDNNEVGKRPWFDASMTWRIGSMLEHWPGRYARKHMPAIQRPTRPPNLVDPFGNSNRSFP